MKIFTMKILKIFNSFIFQLAVFSALIYSIGNTLELLKVNYLLFGFWVGFNPTIGGNIEASSKRLLGIIGGGFIGFVTMVAFNQNTLSVGLGLGLTVLLCYGLGIPKSAGQAIVSFVMVAIGHYDMGLERYYWERFSYNSTGVIMGTIATLLMPPPPSTKQLQEGFQDILMQGGTFYQVLVNEYLKPQTTDEKKIQELDRQINQILAKNSKLLGSALIELSQGMGSSSEEESLENQHQLIIEIVVLLTDLKQFINLKHKNALAQVILPEISYLTQTTYQFFQILGQFSAPNLAPNKPLQLPDLTQALTYLEHRLEELGEDKQGHDYELKQVIELSAWLDDIKQISSTLIRLEKMQLSNLLSSQSLGKSQ
jgi:uncharacterized membrane protein YgaE (UPF0421/DUF939 family)